LFDTQYAHNSYFLWFCLGGGDAVGTYMRKDAEALFLDVSTVWP